MKILAIGAHFDDVELGCGGSLVSWRNQGHELMIFTASLSGYSDPHGMLIRSNETARKEGAQAAAYLEAQLFTGNIPTFELEFAEPLNCKLINVLSQGQPDIVLTHWCGDAHHDHRALALSSLQCCRHLPRVLMYQSNWYASDREFAPRFFVDISEVFDEKMKLIEMYASEYQRTGKKWQNFMQAQASLMGLQIGVQFAEGFEVIRWQM